MSLKLHNYREQLRESLEYQRAGDEESEDRILAALDKLWLSMNQRERAIAKQIASELAKGITNTTSTISTFGYSPVLTTLRVAEPVARWPHHLLEDGVSITYATYSGVRGGRAPARESLLCLSA